MCKIVPDNINFMEASIISNAPFAVRFLERILDYYKSNNAPFLASFLGRIKLKHIRKKVMLPNTAENKPWQSNLYGMTSLLSSKRYRNKVNPAL